MSDFWRDRGVFLTGHTGFKGAWLALWLRELGAEVMGFALPPHTRPNLYSLLGMAMRSHFGNVCDSEALRQSLLEANPQIVIHMAAQALVKESYSAPLETFATNIMGTANLLQACRELPRLQCVLIITSDKVYENRGVGAAFEEGDRLGGHDPYSNSKACAELVTGSFRDSFFADGPPIATARAGNVIGGGDWSANRVIPDCVRALEAGKPVNLRYPDATRPWQHVLEPLSGYLTLARALVESPAKAPRAVNFGPHPASFLRVHEVVDAFSARFGGKPGWRGDPSLHPPEAQVLTLSSALAERSFGWRPTLDQNESVAWTADWYQAYTAGEDMLKFTREQVSEFSAREGLLQ